jgi:UPF0176 protein
MTNIQKSISSSKIEIAALYKFVRLHEYEALRDPLQTLCNQHGVTGILLLAREGINGTLAGVSAGLHAVLEGLKSIDGLQDLEWKTSYSDHMPFLRMKVRIKAEIVTIGDQSVDPTQIVGTYVEPKDWNALISDPDMVVIDTRNSYETRIGTFEGALDPHTKNFSEFPDYVRENFDPQHTKKVAMFCTGGIRCEKASALMRQIGFEEVYHLKGGILKYLEEVQPEISLWNGACFVFDERVAVGHGLKVQDYKMCYGCREPITADDCLHPDFELGVSCHYCSPHLTPEQRKSARERQRQIKLARTKGKVHMGPKAKHRF